MRNFPIALIIVIFIMAVTISWMSKPAYTHIVNDDTFTVDKVKPTVLDVLANDVFDPGADVRITSVTQPKHGKVIINPDGKTLTYIPFRKKRVGRMPGGQKVHGKNVYIGNADN